MKRDRSNQEPIESVRQSPEPEKCGVEVFETALAR